MQGDSSVRFISLFQPTDKPPALSSHSCHPPFFSSGDKILIYERRQSRILAQQFLFIDARPPVDSARRPFLSELALIPLSLLPLEEPPADPFDLQACSIIVYSRASVTDKRTQGYFPSNADDSDSRMYGGTRSGVLTFCLGSVVISMFSCPFRQSLYIIMTLQASSRIALARSPVVISMVLCSFFTEH